MRGTRKFLTAATAVSALAIAGSGSASRPMPCWKVVINEWYSGKLTRTFPARCYTEAAAHLPNTLPCITKSKTGRHC